MGQPLEEPTTTPVRVPRADARTRWAISATFVVGGLASLWLISLGVLATLWGNSFTRFDGEEPGFPWGPLLLGGAGVAVGVATVLSARWLGRGAQARRASRVTAA